MPSRTFQIITLGCKVNQYESAFLKEKLLQAGYIEIPGHQATDICIINTCIVTQRAAYQSRQAIHRIMRANPMAKVIVTGCYAQVYKEELADMEGIDLIAGNDIKAHLPQLITNLSDANQLKNLPNAPHPAREFELLPIKGFIGRTRAFLKIQDGCESYCSYCIVPYARGPLRSLGPQKVQEAIQTLASEGYLEVVLTGIHLGKYGHDRAGRSNLVELLRRLTREKLGLRIRLSSLEPQEIGEELIEMIASENQLCRHLHIPLQSGDDDILQRMNRHYTARGFFDLVQQIHDKIPFAAIGVDVMAGFPGETEAAHQNTVSLIRDLPVSYLHVFPFSRREGTPAAGFSGQIDPETKKQRAEVIRCIGQEKRRAFYQACLGHEFMVLTEGRHGKSKTLVKGLSDNYLPIVFSSDLAVRNCLVPITAEKIKGEVITGRHRASASSEDKLSQK